MPHTQTIPVSQRHWEHTKFEGRRSGTNGDGDQRRYWAVVYCAYATEQDAADDRNPVTRRYQVGVKGSLVDRFFWNSDLGEYTQLEAQVGACLAWLLTANPTDAEFAETIGLAETRAVMAGTPMFGGAFTVTELPAERASE